jgi:hypothetical protein
MKISSPQELQQELKRLMKLSSQKNPSRKVLAEELKTLAGRTDTFQVGDKVDVLAFKGGRRVRVRQETVKSVSKAKVTLEDGTEWSSKSGQQYGKFGPMGSKIGIPWIEKS